MKNTKRKIVALIPLRGGSKSIPYKNIKEIAGKPLAYWALFAAVNAKNIDEVYVSTEDEKIKKTIKSFNLKIKIIDRPKELANDTSSTESVMLHFMDNVNFDILVTIQATSPFTTNEDIDKAIEQFTKDGNDSLLTGVLVKKFFWTKNGMPLNYDYLNRPRRQDFEGVINENGAFYITKKEVLQNYKNRLGEKIGVYEMSADKIIDIDELSDWEIAEKLLTSQKVKNEKR